LTLSLNLRLDLRLRGYIPYGAILQIAFSIWFILQDKASNIKDLREKNLRMLGNYSRRLQDYSRISGSTFQPQDASSTLEDLWLVVLRDA
jgi:hypothetical protein